MHRLIGEKNPTFSGNEKKVSFTFEHYHTNIETA